MLSKSPSLAEILKMARKRQDLSLTQIELETRIRPQYITALENQNYDELPADIYLQQILNTYCDYLGLDYGLIYKIFLKERRQFTRTQRSVFSSRSTEEELASRNFIEPVKSSFLSLSPKTLVFSMTLVLVLLVTSYVGNLYLNYVASPDLELSEPRDMVTVDGDSVLVSGRTDAGAQVTINGSTLPTDEAGNFSVSVDLKQDGNNDIQIVATSKKNPQKFTTEKRTVVANLPDSVTKPSGQLVLELKILNTSWISVSADEGQLLFEGTLPPASIKTFNAKEYFTVLAGNAGGVEARFNDNPPSVLGEQGEVKSTVFGRSEASELLLSYNRP